MGQFFVPGTETALLLVEKAITNYVSILVDAKSDLCRKRGMNVAIDQMIANVAPSNQPHR